MYAPMGDQPRAIEQIAESIEAGNRFQTILGATGTGKTATMAWAIERLQRPALVIAHNKTLAAQLCNEFREFFPENAVEYFVSYYDYYQPEAYVPQADLYIEKDSSQNDDIARLRLAATSALFTRRDVVVVASVSCIYGLGSPEEWRERVVILEVGEDHDRDAMLRKLIDSQYVRNDTMLGRGRFRVKGRCRGGAARQPGDGLPHLLFRGRGRADQPLRSLDGRDLHQARQHRHLAGDGVRHVQADGRARCRGDQARAR
jgi:excinuclease ABC subunit B